jgi:nucleoside-diphosphate-sugar epimerase
MNKKIKIVVIGGTGLIGTKLVNNLRHRGQEVVAASPSSGVNIFTGEGLAEALTGAQVVVDLSNAPSWEDKAVLEFFETAGRNLLVLKNAIDWASRPHGDSAWNGKPAAIMGASTGAIGTARAQNHLRQILVYLNMFPIRQVCHYSQTTAGG